MKSNTRYTVVYLPPETPNCPQCGSKDFVPFVKDEEEYAKCVKCGTLVKATHYEHVVACEDDACVINPIDFKKVNDYAKKK